MSLIRNALSSISKCEQDALMVAFDGRTPMYITLKDNYFVGVHIGHLKNLEILEKSEGGFFYGRVIQTTDDCG